MSTATANVYSSTYPITCPPTIKEGALITFVGEAPGWQEERDREGFVGGSGALLGRMCKAAGISLSTCNKSNVVKRRPPKDDFGVFYHDPKKRKQPTQELVWYRKLLIAELAKYRPNLVVACGNEALKAICGVSGITNWNGSLLLSTEIEGLKVMPMVHPAFIMRDNWHFYYICIRYLKRAKIEESAPHIIQKEPPDVCIIRPKLSQVLELLSWIQTSDKEWHLDIETRGDTLHCFGLFAVTPEGPIAICVPIQTTTGPYWSVAEEAAIFKQLSLAARDNPHLSNQNLVYDIDYLLDYGVEPSGFSFDPMIGMNVAYPEFPKGLDFTTALYTFYPYYKDEGKTWNKKVPDEHVWNYNCKDMVTTPKVTAAVRKDLEEAKLYDLYRSRSHACLPVAIEMQRNRLRLQREWHAKLADFLSAERTKKQEELDKMVGYPINVKSSPQIQKLLFLELGLPAKRKRGTDNLTSEEDALKELRAANPNIPQLNLILEVRHLRTKESNYINVTFDNDPDGELYLGYQANIPGTKTGRWSFSKSPKWRGSSPQTIPKVMRLMYQPPVGSVFWQRDLSQAEVRIVAWLAECRFLLTVFSSPIKIHKLVAGRIFKKKPEEIENDSIQYDVAKKTVHAYDYKMGYKKLAIQCNVPNEFAKVVLDDYGREVPEISQWHQQVKETVIRTGRLVTPLGRVRDCFKACGALANTGTLPEDILRDLVSYVPQATVPDLVNEAMLKLWNENPWVKWHQQGHDSYLASGDPKRTHEFYEKAESAGNIHFIINGRDCYIPGEFQWGYLWGALLKYNPGEDTSYEAWKERATREGYFDEGKIKEKLYAML